MPNTFLMKRNNTQGAVPTVGQLQLGELAVNTNDGRVFLKRNNGSDSVVQLNSIIIPLLNWFGVSGLAPTETFEFDDRAFVFSQGMNQAIVCYVRVPANFISGNRINLRASLYSSGNTNFIRLRSTATLIKKNVDVVSTSTNSHNSTNSDQSLTVANRYIETTFDLTDATGKINNVLVESGDLLKIQIQRIAPSGAENTSDLKILANASEIIFL